MQDGSYGRWARALPQWANMYPALKTENPDEDDERGYGVWKLGPRIASNNATMLSDGRNSIPRVTYKRGHSENNSDG